MNYNLLNVYFYSLDFINVTLVSDDQRILFTKTWEESVIDDKRFFKNQSIKLALILLIAF